jgi:hypothetical protein
MAKASSSLLIATPSREADATQAPCDAHDETWLRIDRPTLTE